jgi:ribosomal protein L24E
MYEPINEPIQVRADFTNRGPKPKSFIWKNRKYEIREIEFSYTALKGDTKMFYFSVSTETETYKIFFNPKTLNWTLEEIFLNTNFSTSKNLNEKNNNAYRLR